MSKLAFRFWGVRGSLAAAGPHTLRYGGNTPCLEVRAGDELFVVDLGSGARALGASLGAGPVRATLLMTHYHHDHLQGLPFFAPLYHPESEIAVHGPLSEGQTVREAVEGHLARPYFPVGLEVFPSTLSFHTVVPEQRLAFGELGVQLAALNHPGGSMGYRFELEGRTLCYATDVEPDEGPSDARLIELARGASWLVIDAMYTPDEYAGRQGPSRRGFGHATWEFATRVAREAGASNLVLCHHDPARTDAALDALVVAARAEFPSTRAAREGELIEV